MVSVLTRLLSFCYICILKCKGYSEDLNLSPRDAFTFSQMMMSNFSCTKITYFNKKNRSTMCNCKVVFYYK